MKANIPPFYIGQKVIYITGIMMPKNTDCIVTDIWQHSCGCWAILINRKNPPSPIVNHCMIHGRINPDKRGWKASSFRPLQEATAPLMTFKEIVEVEKEEILIMN